MTRTFAVVCEAPADFAIATELADRVFVEKIDWVEEDLLDALRRWVDRIPQHGEFTWQRMRRIAGSLAIRLHGHFDGRPGMPDAHAARRAIAVLRRCIEPLDAIVLIRDADDQNERRIGLEQARESAGTPVVIVIGLAISKRECWVLAGFEPADDAERGRLDAERQELGFNPCARSHKLSATQEQALRSAKRVLAALTGDDKTRERQCWRDSPLELLRERGGDNGLTEYLAEVEAYLAPLLG